MDNPDPSSKKIKQVLTALEKQAIPFKHATFEKPAHHAAEAAALLGCPLGAVIKSLIFKIEAIEDPLLVLVSGKNQVDFQKLDQMVGQECRPMAPKDIKKLTGFSVGAVPPFGFTREIPVIIDADLQAYHYLWASAGEVNSLIRIKFADLLTLTGGMVAPVKQV